MEELRIEKYLYESGIKEYKENIEDYDVKMKIKEELKDTEERIKEIEEPRKEMAEQILNIYSEIYPYLYWIVYNYPDPVLKEIKMLKESIEQRQIIEINSSFIDEIKLALMPPISAVQSMRRELIQLMTNDPRLLKK